MKPLRRALPILSAAVLAAAFFAAGARAQEPTPGITGDGSVSDDAVNEIASQMFCPVCENVPLDVCPTQACHQWRETIRQLLAEGKTEDEIKAYFVERYGDRVLAAPPRRGINWLVYIVPPVVIALGALALARSLRSWRAAAHPAETDEPPPIPQDDYIRRLEDELERRA